MSEKSEVPSKQHKTIVDKDVRLRILKEKQNEERQRKLEEIKAQAFAAQRFKEQKEHERRQRLEEMRIKEEIRRQQVEERKRAINDAERDRLESILRRNQQRENRLETKKRNERSSMVFAFGSSTPRNLDPNDVAPSFWGHRRATSTQNITACAGSSITRRGVERDMENGSKKRATSAGGLERAGETSSRPSSSMSHQSTTSVTSSVSVRHRPSSGPRKPRPASIAVTGVSVNQDKKPEITKPPLPKRKSITKSTERVSKSKPSTGENTPKPLASPTATDDGSVIEAKLNGNTRENHKKPPDTVQVAPEVDAKEVAVEDLLNLESECVLQNGTPVQQPEKDNKTSIPVVNETEVDSRSEIVQAKGNNVNKIENLPQVDDTKVTDSVPSSQVIENVEATTTTSVVENIETDISKNKEMSASITSEMFDSQINKEMTQVSSEMTASQIKAKISTEEEAKAAIAERRRLAKEEAARRAEQERLRIEAEQKAEMERQRQEEEQVRILIEAQRAAEEQRLNEAIMEAKKKEEEEQQRREEEARQKALKEEADKKARLEAEKQKAEQQERLIKEEKEREARRKRVEAIMLRTRGKQNANHQQNSDDSCENKSENKVNGTKPTDEQNGSSMVKEDRVDNM
ncbi:hypothetical protein WA026_004356 [Henosepilachna vigintioctopunctata]|uniref:Ensconsin n=1 Tax=Henosepilachna vigintioctopunctata TaxID=420089 RepID=A0AAW1V1C3_9CUCU